MSGRRTPPRKGGNSSAEGAPSGFDRLVHDIARRPVKVRSGGGVQEMSMVEVTLLATIQAAGSGNSHAAWIALDAMRQAEERIAAETEATRADFDAFRLRQLRHIAAAEASGEDSTPILPHPDDIDPWHPAGPRITGPADGREWQEVLVTLSVVQGVPAAISRPPPDHREAACGGAVTSPSSPRASSRRFWRARFRRVWASRGSCVPTCRWTGASRKSASASIPCSADLNPCSDEFSSLLCTLNHLLSHKTGKAL